MLSLTTTSVSFNLTQPEGGLSIDECSISLGLASQELQLCRSEEGEEEEEEEGGGENWDTGMTVHFVNLSEFSVYSMTVTVGNKAHNALRTITFEFSTLSGCMSAPIIQYL